MPGRQLTEPGIQLPESLNGRFMFRRGEGSQDFVFTDDTRRPPVTVDCFKSGRNVLRCHDATLNGIDQRLELQGKRFRPSPNPGTPVSQGRLMTSNLQANADNLFAGGCILRKVGSKLRAGQLFKARPLLIKRRSRCQKPGKNFTNNGFRRQQVVRIVKQGTNTGTQRNQTVGTVGQFTDHRANPGTQRMKVTNDAGVCLVAVPAAQAVKQSVQTVDMSPGFP